MSTRYHSRRSLGLRTEALGRSLSIRTTKRRRPLNGILRSNMPVDLSFKERYARIFFSGCLFPNLCLKSSLNELRQEKESGMPSVVTWTTSEKCALIASLGRYGLMTARLRVERLKNTIPLSLRP